MAEALLDRAPSPRRYVLTAVEFDVLWERLGLGPTPVVLQIPSPGRTASERRDVQAQGHRGLRDRGLAGPDGPDPALARQLRVLARPFRQLELRGSWGGPVRALAGGQPGSGVLATRRDATVTLEYCGSLPSAVLGLLPPAGPGPGRATTAPTAVIAAGLSAPSARMRAVLVDRGLPAGDATLLIRMLGPGPGRAQIVAMATDPSGAPHRCGGVLGVLDGVGGRYLMTRRTADDGVEWSTVAPIDDRRLRYRIGELLEQVGAAAG